MLVWATFIVPSLTSLLDLKHLINIFKNVDHWRLLHLCLPEGGKIFHLDVFGYSFFYGRFVWKYIGDQIEPVYSFDEEPDGTRGSNCSDGVVSNLVRVFQKFKEFIYVIYFELGWPFLYNIGVYHQFHEIVYQNLGVGPIHSMKIDYILLEETQILRNKCLSLTDVSSALRRIWPLS